MKLPAIYIPMDRRQAMARGEELPDRTSGAALLADISGFTPLTDALVKELGPRRGAYELTRQLNVVYGRLIAEVHRYQGSVIGFSGDAITCWFDGDPPAPLTAGPSAVRSLPVGLPAPPAVAGQAGLRATACALAMQQAMGQLAAVETPYGVTVALAMKAAVAAGPVRRFRVGDPQIQYIDVLAGGTLDRMATAEQQAKKGEVVVGPGVISQLGDKVTVAQWRQAIATDQLRQLTRQGHTAKDTPPGTEQTRFAVVSGLTGPVEATPWPSLPPPTFPPFEGEGTRGGWVTEGRGLTEARVRPWLLPPVYERLKAGRGRFLAEIRPAVALFLRFGGLEYDQDEAAGEKLDAYIQWVQRVLAGYEGYLIQLTIGDKGSYLYAAFGAPLAHDDDPARAVAAALELRSPPVELDFSNGVQIGVSQGRMRAGAYGHPTRRTYGVLGDEVNAAARLMSKAEPGQIMVSQRIAGAVARSYHLEDIGLVEIKGRRQPLPVSVVLGKRLPSQQRPATIFTNPLVGRDDELAQLEQVLASVLAGEGQILRLEGAAGVGKSHLTAEFIERSLDRNFRVAVGTCQSTAQGIVYYPWRQALRALFGLKDELLAREDPTPWAARQVAQVKTTVEEINPDWQLRLPLLGDLLDLPIPDNEATAAFDPKLRQEALFALAVEMVQTWAHVQPLLLLIEDAHWLDEASGELMLALGRVIAKAPVLLMLVHRPRSKPILPDLNRSSYYHHLELQELTSTGVTTLVSNRLQGQVSPLVLDLIQARAQGNPFFSEELVDVLQETSNLQRQEDGLWTLSESIFTTLHRANCLTKKNGHWALVPNAPLEAVALDIPDTIHGIVLSRLDRLPESHKLTMKVASVIGHTFECDLLVRSHPGRPDQAALLKQLVALEGRDLIRLEAPQPQRTYMFKHNITQEVAYETLLKRQQRELHQAVGEALEALQAEAVERLAYHYRLGEVREKTLFYLDKAARKTQREYANETALNYYNQALVLEERWTWRQGQVEILHLLGRREEEEASLQALAANPIASALEVAYLQGQYHEVMGNYAQAQAAVERALVAGRERGHLTGQVRCLAQLGLIAYRQGDHERAKAWYNRALALFQPQETDPDEATEAFAQAFHGLGIVHRQQGEFDQARTCYKQALALSRMSGDRQREANIFNDLGATAFHQRHFAEARTYHRQALAIRRATGDRAGEGTCLYNLAIVTMDAGDYGQAQRYLSAALTILQATGNRWHEISVWNSLGILYQELGDLSRAQSCLEQGLQLAQEIGAEERQVYPLSNLGLVMRDQGDLDAAERVLNEGLTLVQAADNKRQASFFLSYLSTVSLQAGRLEPAVEQARAALRLWEALGLCLRTTDDLATLAAAHLVAGQVTEALAFAEQTLAILAESGGEGPEFPQRDYLICYQVLAAAGQKEQARAALQAAYDLVIGRAEKITDPALRQSFLERVAVNREIVAEAKQKLSDII